MSFNDDLIKQFNAYREKQYGDQKHPFDKEFGEPETRPPVFDEGYEDLNVLQKKDATDVQTKEVIEQLHPTKRHRWFRSMKSSQALAQSVFANLTVHQKLSVLSSLSRDDSQPLFISSSDNNIECKLEYSLPKRRLNEIASTEVDVLLTGQMTVAVECKFTEVEVGSCTIPKREREKNDTSEKTVRCNGNYKQPDDCYLSNKKIKYWEFIPKLFKWDADAAYSPCPIILPYQLIRNILAAVVTENGDLNLKSAHAVLLYDERNRAFQQDGTGMNAWTKCKEALKYPHLLQKCSWQELVATLKQDSELIWLTDALNDKYGIEPNI